MTEHSHGGTIRHFHENGTIASELLPDRTERFFDNNGQLKAIRLSDGSIHYTSSNEHETYNQTANTQEYGYKYAIDYFNNYKKEHPDDFISPDALERFNQIVTHATGNIIWNNRFDLRYAGSSEGGAAFGFGAYFESNPAVAETYRRFGLPKGSEGIVHIFTNDGQEFIANNYTVEKYQA